MKNNYLSVKNLNFEYPDGFKALSNINFEIEKNERIAVLGPNGAGKTTLILHLNGILGDLDGKIKIKEFLYGSIFGETYFARFSELGGGPLGHTLGCHQNFDIFILKTLIMDKPWQGLLIIMT